EPLEHGPELLGPEEVNARVDLAERELAGRGVSGLDDAREPPVAAADDPAVRAEVAGLEGQHRRGRLLAAMRLDEREHRLGPERRHVDRKSTRLNSSHVSISYAVFCL